MSLFSSDREDEAKRLYGKQYQSYDDLIKQIQGQPDFFGDVSNLQDVRKKFGISGDLSGTYAPLKRNLSTALARQRGTIASRQGNSATPEFQYSPAESSYATSLGSLEASQGQEEANQQDYVANLLDRVLGQRQQFGEQKIAQQQSALGAESGLDQNYLSNLSNTSLFDDLLSGGGIIAGGLGALGFNPFKKKSNTQLVDINSAGI